MAAESTPECNITQRPLSIILVQARWLKGLQASSAAPVSAVVSAAVDMERGLVGLPVPTRGQSAGTP
eukprot:4608289-Pyramimonas_sp.AAC.1